VGTFGENLTKAREFNGYSRPKAAELLGTNKPSYRNWERDLNYPSMEYVVKISQFYNVSIDWLLNNKVIENKEKEIEKYIEDMEKAEKEKEINKKAESK
jgi:transcriptional regulator with XRE-family HTH domain